MSKHSPAPWYWTKNGNWQEGSGKWLASQTGMVLDYSGCGTHKCDVTEEDAHLIAAAPELLAALKGMIEVFGDKFGMGDSSVCDDARAAIAKATGKKAA